MKWWAKYQVDVPEGRSGAWAISRFTVSETDAKYERMRALFNRGRHVPEGTYTKLTRSGAVIMSDTPDEIRDHISAIDRAQGRVLIGGLGLGVIARAVLLKPDVEHVTIIERSPDVIKLVSPWLARQFLDRVELIEADILEWQAPVGSRWDVAWFDIWDAICSDNLDQMKALHRRFGRSAKWKGSWCREMVERQTRAGW